MNSANPRKAALELLCRMDTEGTYSNLGIQETLNRVKFTPENRRLFTRLVYGVAENKTYLDFLLEKASATPLKKMKPWVLNSLRMGLYQLIWMDRVPESAAINESVKLVKLRYGALGGFVNAVLRAIQRNKSSFFSEIGDTPEAIAVRYSHPQWLVDRWVARFGFEGAKAILIADNTASEMTLRANCLKTTPDALIASLERHGVRVRKSRYFEAAIDVEDLGDVELPRLKEYVEGWFTVQDTSSMMVAMAIAPKAGDKVLDLCAAPGGKATHVAELMGNQGSIAAQDVHPHKLKLIEENAARLGIGIITATEGDASVLNPDWLEGFDHVLLDAPCSGTGIIRKKPEIRYNRSIEDIIALSELQLAMLQVAGRYVKNHGQLIYSTCTMEYEENQGVIEAFMNQCPEFSLIDISERLPETLGIQGVTAQTFPGESGLDGFFIALMRKKVAE